MSDTEELIPLLLPDDEEGYSWSLRYMTKEEAEKTIAMNLDNYSRDSMSREIIESNYQCVVDMGYEEELNGGLRDYATVKEVAFTILVGLCIGTVVALVVSMVMTAMDRH